MDSETQIEDPGVWREVEVDASPDQVWETIATEAGRDLWLEPGAGDTIEVSESDPPNRLVWFWGPSEQPARRVEFLIVGAPAGTRVIVIESAPSLPLPLTMLAAAGHAVAHAGVALAAVA